MNLSSDRVVLLVEADPRDEWLTLTSSPEEQDVLETHRLGATGCVRKPVDLGQFSKAMRQLGLAWLVEDAAAWPRVENR